MRKYIEGKKLVNGSLVYPDVLSNAVEALHVNGVAGLEGWGRNIIVDPTGKPYIIDLGLCIFKEKVGEGPFEKHKETDLEGLEDILKSFR